MDWLTVDGFVVPVLENTWTETVLIPGSSKRTETGQLRSVRLGEPVSEYVGETLFALRATADTLRELLNTYGAHEIEGLLPGRVLTVESNCGRVQPAADRPTNSAPAAKWRLGWTMKEVGAGLVGS